MTSTITQTSTYSDSRANYVMEKVFEDFTALIVRGFATDASIKKWKSDLLYIMGHGVLSFFELQFRTPDGRELAVRYHVKDDNSLSEDSDSGGLKVHSLPAETKAKLFAKLNTTHAKYNIVHAELHGNRGWGFGGQVDGTSVQNQAYSKEGYGVQRQKIGSW